MNSFPRPKEISQERKTDFVAARLPLDTIGASLNNEKSNELPLIPQVVG